MNVQSLDVGNGACMSFFYPFFFPETKIESGFLFTDDDPEVHSYPRLKPTQP